MKSSIVALVILLCCSCETAQKTVYGIKKPRLENSSSMTKYLKRQDQDTTSALHFKNMNCFLEANRLKLLRIPDALFFNSEGDFVPYRTTPQSCNANVDAFIKDLQNFGNKPFESHKTVTKIKKLVNEPNKVKPADITVFITWTRYAGRLNKEKAFQWVKLLEKAKANGTNVQYYLLNCDVQESWNLSPQELKEMGIKS